MKKKNHFERTLTHHLHCPSICPEPDPNQAFSVSLSSSSHSHHSCSVSFVDSWPLAALGCYSLSPCTSPILSSFTSSVITSRLLVFNSLYSWWLSSATSGPTGLHSSCRYLTECIQNSVPDTLQYLLHHQTSLMNSVFPVAQSTTVVSYMIYFLYMLTGIAGKYTLGSTLKNIPNSTTCFVTPVLVRTKIISHPWSCVTISASSQICRNGPILLEVTSCHSQKSPVPHAPVRVQFKVLSAASLHCWLHVLQSYPSLDLDQSFYCLLLWMMLDTFLY